MRSTGVLGTCARVLSVEVLSQITPTLQTRPGARRRERLAVWHRSGLHVAPRRASFDFVLRKVASAAFGRFRSLSAVGAAPPVPRCQDTPISCSMRTRPRYATRRLESPARHWPTADSPTDTPDPVPTDRRPCGVCSVGRCDWTADGAAGCHPVGGALCAVTGHVCMECVRCSGVPAVCGDLDDVSMNFGHVKR